MRDDESAATDRPAYRIVTEGDVAVIRIGHDRLRLSEAQELGEAFDGPLRDHKRVLMNLTGVTYLDSTGVSLLVRIAAGKQLRLVGVGVEVDRVLRKMEMRELFSLHETERSAMESFTG